MAKEIKVEEMETMAETVSIPDVTDAAMLNTLLEEIAQLKAQLASTPNVETASAPQEKSVQEWLNERVPYIAFKDNDKYKDDIHVIINGHSTIIKRGVQVMIPRYVHMAIQDSEKQTLIADIKAEEKSKSFDNESKTRGFDN